mmetsp:Transcript_10642/g.21047  ORF Transcript_10642/g.21047 Transcript_10642/m.21047 type:complete len:311 (-) Transcript_10642:263-1195(-)
MVSDSDNDNGNDNYHHLQDNEKAPPLAADVVVVVSNVKRRLWEETVDGLGNIVGNLRAAWYTGDETVFYKREEQRLNKYIPPFQYGLAAFAFVFVNFRVTGNPGFQNWRKAIWERIQPTPSFKTKSETMSKASQQQRRQQQRQRQEPKLHPSIHKSPPTMGYLETKRKNEVEKALKSMKYLTDFLVSLSIGTSGALFLLEAKCGKDLRSDFEEAPLVAGRSLVADEMCPGMLELYRSDPRLRKVFEDNSNHQHRAWEASTFDPNLQTFSTFINNCKKRKDHESRLQKEQQQQQGNQLKSGAIVIPYTGVQ